MAAEHDRPLGDDLVEHLAQVAAQLLEVGVLAGGRRRAAVPAVVVDDDAQVRPGGEQVADLARPQHAALDVAVQQHDRAGGLLRPVDLDVQLDAVGGA